MRQPQGNGKLRAACRGRDPELFFPVGSDGPAALAQITEAKQTCARCPVHTACLVFAMTTGQEYGIWRGLTEDERRRSRRRESREARRRPMSRAAPDSVL